MRKILFAMTLLLASLFSVVFGQESVTVSGVVTSADDGLPLIGATVLVKGTSSGTTTGLDGEYSIQTSVGSTLLFSYVGTETARYVVPAGGNKHYKVVLASDSKQLEDVVVVAYGTKKKGTIAGSVSVVKADKMENTPAATFEQALQGQSPGLTVLANSGEPSAPATFQIRGINSINAGTTPLFILDGVAISSSDFSSINPNDIESVSVLKDASSTSIYGARAANGVVVITTRRGKMNEKGQVRVRAQYGVSRLAYGKWNQMNTTERLNYEEEVGIRIPGDYDRSALERINVDWRKEVYNNSAPFANAEASFNGGTSVMNYFISGGYYKQEGVALGSDFSRYNLRANLNVRVNPWLRVGTNTMLSYEQIEEAVDGEYTTVTPISASRFMLPYWSPYAKDGSIASLSNGTWLGSNQNPLEWMANNPMSKNKAKVITTLFAEFELYEGLTFKTLGGLDAMDLRTNQYSNSQYVPNYGVGKVGKGFQRTSNLTWTNTLNYVFDVKEDHNLNFLLGQESVKQDMDAFNSIIRGQTNDKLLNMSTGTDALSWGDSGSGSTFLSFFGRGEYNYLNKYYADFSVREEASSKFGKNARWATFWSVGLMWNAKGENFLGQYDWLTNAQLAFSIGTSGNSFIPPYDHLALIGGGAKYNGMAGLAPYSRGNEDLTWEKVMTTNVGLRLGFVDRINLNVEFYNKKTSDMLMEVPIVFESGQKYKWDNIGAMVNRGVELDVNVDVIRNRNFVWNISANASYNHNEITELYNGKDEYEMGNTGTLLKVGHSCGEFYINRFAGVNPANGDAMWYDKNGNLTTVYDEGDRVLIGKDYFAPWQGGFGTTLSYKGISVGATFSWVADRWMMNNDRYFDESNGTFASMNQSKKLLYDRWKQPGDNAAIPRHGIPTEMDTRLLEDASFLRLKNLSVSYDLPSQLLRKTKFFDKTRVYFQAQNLFTFTKFQGMDPESSMNIYQASYPMARQFSFGIEVSF
ncbi:MAG: TonB-dependent receptor [Bacteroidales bacterium]